MQPASTLNTNDIQKQTIPPQKDSYKLDSTECIRTDPITNFERTKQIIMGIDALSHLPELCNKILQKLNLSGLCQYSKLCKAYIFEKSNHVVNCCHVLTSLRQSTCYVTTPSTPQWYKINANEILEKHKSALGDDQSAHMVPLPPAEPPEINAFAKITRLAPLKAQDGPISDNCKQCMYSNIPLVNQNMECSHQCQDVHHHNQSTVILQ